MHNIKSATMIISIVHPLSLILEASQSAIGVEHGRNRPPKAQMASKHIDCDIIYHQKAEIAMH